MLKFIFTFISIGGANVALFAVKDVPHWLRVTSLMLSAAALIYALEDLPKAMDALETTIQRVVAWSPHVDRTSSANADTSAPPTLAPTADAALPVASPTLEPPLSLLPAVTGSETAQTPSPSPSFGVGTADLAVPENDGIETDPHLIIREGGNYRLGQGRVYYLDAPMGYTVGYIVEDGSVSFFMDGKLRAQCMDSEYRTYAAKSRFSAIACSATALLRVIYVRSGNEIRLTTP